jgi:formate dehydrogenase maturation protein FdhE
MMSAARDAYDHCGVAVRQCPNCASGPVVTFYYQPAGVTGAAAVACRACRKGILITRARTPDWYEGAPEPFDFESIRR